MPGVQLPSLPRGSEFEELVAALFQTAGRFVERDIVQREELDILQLDVMATDYSQKPIVQCLVEAKGGDWGFHDIFKIKGWTTYLGVPEAKLVTLPRTESIQAYSDLAKKVGIDLCVVTNVMNPKSSILELTGVEDVDEKDVISWRYLYWTERYFLDLIRKLKRHNLSAQRFKAILNHAFQINSGVFFEPTVSDRITSLYKTYSEFQHLAARCSHEMIGGDLSDREGLRIPEEIFEKTFRQNEVNEIQVACWLENRARLTLLKAAIDYLALKQDGQYKKAERKFILKFRGKEIPLPMVDFPARFRDSLDLISKQPSFRHYPVLWQWFLGIFGGFILLDFQDQEYDLLSRKSSVPKEQVPIALEIYDKMFPQDEGWFSSIGDSRILQLKLVPGAIKGIGANYRRLLYTSDAKFESLKAKLTGKYTYSDLIAWNNCTIELLRKKF